MLLWLRFISKNVLMEMVCLRTDTEDKYKQKLKKKIMVKV